MKVQQSLFDNLTAYYTPKNTNTLETTNNQDMAIVYYRNQDIKTIKEMSGDLAISNEYQVHYVAVVKKEVYKDNSIQINVFPIAYYNYHQKVSAASIDFEMKDVSKKAEEIKDIATTYAKELIKELQELPLDDTIASIEYSITLFNNIHKHP